MRNSQYLFLPVSIVVVFLLVGCGQNAGNGSTTPSPTETPSPTALPPNGSVTLQMRETSYQQGSTVSVTIQNQSKQTISFADHRTNCTALLIERQVVDAWAPVALCKLMIMTRIHFLKAGEKLEVKLATSDQWPTGQYRARLDYSISSGAGFGAPITIYSSQFRVG